MNKASLLDRLDKIDIYPVTCENLSAGRSNVEVLTEVIRGGAKIIQLREKQYCLREFYKLAVIFRKITTEAGVLLIINDHVDIALAVQADGIHLGQDDLPVPMALKLAPGLIIGASTHNREEALQAQKDGADYINIGPIYPTKTKEKVARFLGPGAIPAISAGIHVPFTVMGGINASNIDEVAAQGARRIAMVSAITKAPDIAETVRMLRKRISGQS
ncbi:MAG: thiamine phosphate synthase [Deltaproteobacteria bacterium]|nr:thiamine phosphate synthase [Deltaproteobacteria bacterium]